MSASIRKPAPCRCEAYAFPHRKDSKACRELYNSAHEAGYEPDSIHSLGLRGLFEIASTQPLRNTL